MFVMFPLHKCPVDTFDIEAGVVGLIDQFLNIVTLKPDHLLIVLELLFSIPPDLTVSTHLLSRWQNNTAENKIPCVPGLGIKHIEGIELILHAQIHQLWICLPEHTFVKIQWPQSITGLQAQIIR